MHRTPRVTPLLALAVLLATGATFAPPARAQTVIPASTISVDTVWDLGGSPYRVTGNVFVEGTDGADGVTTLTVEPGVVVELDDNRYLAIGVGQPGALVADGDAAGGPATILWTSSAASPVGARWSGLRFGAQAGVSILRNATISHAGAAAGFSGALRVEGGALTLEDVTLSDGSLIGSATLYVVGSGATVDVDGCTFRDNLGHDIRLSNGSGSVDGSSFASLRVDSANAQFTFAGNAIASWGETTSRLTPDVAARLGVDNTVTPAAGAVTEILGGVQTVDGAWTSALGTIHVLSQVQVRGTDGADGVTTLTVEGGLTVAFANFHELVAGDFGAGALVVDGDLGPTPGTILFTSLDLAPVGAEWGGIVLADQAGPSVLRKLTIEHAGRGGGPGAVTLDGPPSSDHIIERLTQRENGNLGTTGLHVAGGNVSVVDSAFSGNSSFDLRFAGGSASVTGSTFSTATITGDVPFSWSGNTIDDWGALTGRLTPDAAVLLAHANAVTAAPGARTEVTIGTATVDGTLAPQAGTYDLIDTIAISGSDGPDGVTTLTVLPGTRVTSGRFSANALEIGTDGGPPGRLVAPGGSPAAVFEHAIPGTGGPGTWTGIRVRTSGAVALTDVDIRGATTGLDVRGTLETLRDVTFRRSSTGLLLDGATAATTLEGLRCRAVATCVYARDAESTLRASELEGSSWGVLNFTPTSVVDALGNWWGDPTGPSGAGAGSGAPASAGVLFDPWDGAPADDGDGVPREVDNCSRIANASQADADGDGIGDACEPAPRLTVSSDPADGADFESLQAAVDEVDRDGTRIALYPGLGPYPGPVRVDTGRSISLEGILVPTGGPEPARPAIDGDSTTALFMPSAGATPHRISGVTVRGNRGIDTYRTTHLDDVVFEDLNGFGWYVVDGTDHRLTHGRFSGHGVRVDAGASARVDRSELVGLVGYPFYVEGALSLSSTVIADGDLGIRVADDEAVLDLAFVTLTGAGGVGVDNPFGGAVTIADSIVWDNLGGDLSGVGCEALLRSNTGEVACAGVDGNLSALPLLDAASRLTAASPCVDAGTDVAGWTGWPPFDVDGETRYADGDGDGEARADCGADEFRIASPLDPVRNARFLDDLTLVWDPVLDAVEYHLYGADLVALAGGNLGACLDGLDPDRTDAQVLLFDDPPAGSGTFWLITAENATGEETGPGDGLPSARVGTGGVGCP